jgi:peptidoglycan/xylan/chitin deacetylase (PgdA/CDA1 family)
VPDIVPAGLVSRRGLLAAITATAVAGPVGAGASRPWPNGARAAVSLTYDDGLDSQLTYALPQLQAAGFRATFFLVQENMQARLADWRRVAGLGNEIGDHTETHPCSLEGFSASRFEDTEIRPMERFLNQNFGAAGPRVYAYPCGYIGLGHGPADERYRRYAKLLDGTFEAARTVDGPPMDPRSAWADRMHLSGYEPTYDVDDPRRAYAYLDEAMRHGRWAVLIFHDVLPRRRRAGDTSLASHQAILDFIREKPLWCAPMGEVLARLAPGRRGSQTIAGATRRELAPARHLAGEVDKS